MLTGALTITAHAIIDFKGKRVLLIVLVGPHCSGKTWTTSTLTASAAETTASYTILPEILDCEEFVNADEIAKGLSPFNPESAAIQAGRLMLERFCV